MSAVPVPVQHSGATLAASFLRESALHNTQQIFPIPQFLVCLKKKINVIRN
jgi:hypothetical protein